jgi:Sec-independent protein translocase protein TatA
MEILGIGLQEILFIAVILLLILGPRELATLGRKTGELIRRIRSSDTWLMVSNLAQALRDLPNALADEARTDEIFGNVVPDRSRQTIAPPGQVQEPGRRQSGGGRGKREGYSAWTTAPSPQKETSQENQEVIPEQDEAGSDSP